MSKMQYDTFFAGNDCDGRDIYVGDQVKVCSSGQGGEISGVGRTGNPVVILDNGIRTEMASRRLKLVRQGRRILVNAGNSCPALG